jgi:hypothetical protein
MAALRQKAEVAELLETEALRREAEVAELETGIAARERRIAERERRIADLEESTSWKVTAPFRFLGRRLGR